MKEPQGMTEARAQVGGLVTSRLEDVEFEFPVSDGLVDDDARGLEFLRGAQCVIGDWLFRRSSIRCGRIGGERRHGDEREEREAEHGSQFKARRVRCRW